MVINTLAVKRAQLRGGAWSTAGKSVEIPLMQTLCALFGVPSNHYKAKGLTTQGREVDFYLVDPMKNAEYLCEVKLMGKGNPESADAVIARDSHIFVADTLSELNKTQLAQRGIQWVELKTTHGYKKFFTILQSLGIPSQDFTGDLDKALPILFDERFAPHENT